jgi:hypothetical protein
MEIFADVTFLNIASQFFYLIWISHHFKRFFQFT